MSRATRISPRPWSRRGAALAGDGGGVLSDLDVASHTATSRRRPGRARRLLAADDAPGAGRESLRLSRRLLATAAGRGGASAARLPRPRREHRGLGYDPPRPRDGMARTGREHGGTARGPPASRRPHVRHAAPPAGPVLPDGPAAPHQ